MSNSSIPRRLSPALCLAVFALAVLATTGSGQTRLLKLEQNDRVCLIGNALAERMQYFGHFETLLHEAYPEHKLVVRNLGYGGDEVRFRPRSLDFGSPDQHLTREKADVLIAFFGFSESFAGQKGLATFEAELEEFVKHTRSQKYNGQSPPRLALVSPLAHENLKSPHLPTGEANNVNLKLYTDVLRRVAQRHSLPFVDLFAASQKLQTQSRGAMTFNGVHLTGPGYRALAPVLLRLLTGKEQTFSSRSELVRREVLEKCFQYFHRYRAVNGFYIYGGRSRRDHGNPPYTDAYVIGNELRKLDEMAAVRDRRIWQVAQGGSVPRAIDDSKTRPLHNVPTNFKQPIRILPPAEAQTKFTLAKGYKINLFAGETEFPDLKNPVQFTFDARGRLWVATMPSYPQYQPPHKPADKLLVFEDTDGDGKADKQTVFADDLHVPTGFELGDGGVYVSQQPNLVFLKDTDGDGKADLRKILLHGFDSADSHHSIGAFQWGPGGGIYMHEGTFHHTSVETPRGVVRNAHGGVYRFEPTTQKFETFIHYNFANPWGHCFDRWGQNFVADASGGANYFAAPFSVRAPQFRGQDDFGPFKFAYRRQLKQFFPKRVRPTSGCEIVSSRHFPPEAQGNYLLNNVIGFQGVLQHTVREEGSGFVGQEIEPILFSSDRNFRPTDLQFGPDGALYLVDWFNPLIGHMQHSLRDPNRDHTHGRIWRITYPSRPLLKIPKIEGATIAELLQHLKTPEDRTRQKARLKLREFDSAEVMTELKRWEAGLDKNDSDFEHQLLEGLWIRQNLNVVEQPALVRLLNSPDHRARAAATRVLCHWRDQVPRPLDLLEKLADDKHPRVRLEAVRACSYFDDARAAEVALQVLQHPMDDYLNYTLGETIRILQPFWKVAVGAGRPFAKGNAAAIKYILNQVTTPDLINMVRSEPVFEELLRRHGVLSQYRDEALRGLARLHQTDSLTELLKVVNQLDESRMEHANHVLSDTAELFARQDAKALKARRNDLVKLMAKGRKTITRRVGIVALLSADGGEDRVWETAAKSIDGLADFVSAVPLIPDVQQRERLHQRVAGLLRRLPTPVEAAIGQRTGVQGRYVRIEIPGRGKTLTLAEVEVFSKKKNIAPNGKARQSSTGFGGRAQRALDGNRSGRYTDNGQTHTNPQNDPWWEVDLKGTHAIDAIAVWNRNEMGGKFASRLNGYFVKVLDSRRRVVFQTKPLPAKRERAVISIRRDPRGMIRRLAMQALATMPSQSAKTYGLLAPFVKRRGFRDSAVQAIGKLRLTDVPKAEVMPVVEELVRYIESVPDKQRTQTEVMGAIQLGKDLSGLLDKAQAISIRRKLSELAVDVILIRPVPHRMTYDRTDIYVVAGKRVEIVFQNTDIMPHNLIVVSPGAREEVGILAEKMGATPLGFAKHFVPDSNKVMHSTRMLEPGQQQRLQITAPTAQGDYPYVCTFPGHWRTMYGTMHVVASIDDIPLQPIKPLVKTAPPRPFVRKWTVEDLVSADEELRDGRSFANGKRLFTAVSCSACHQLKGEGGKVGPDLSQLKKKLAEKKIDFKGLLTELVHPSQVIDKKYRTNIIIDDNGRPASGVVVFEDDKIVRLTTSPLDKDAKVREIKKSEIDERTESKVSIMPQGLLNTMTRGEILDLLAYIISAADPNHPAYK